MPLMTAEGKKASTNTGFQIAKASCMTPAKMQATRKP